MPRALACLAFACALSAQPPFPALNYRVVPDWPRPPAYTNFQETGGVAVDSANHVFVFHRGHHPMMEFDANGTFVRGWGDDIFNHAHSVRVDSEGNLWTADDGAHTVLKLDRNGRVLMVFGRWKSPSDAVSSMPDGSAGGALRGLRDEGVIRFNRPTDVAIGPNGDVYVSDGYGNSRVVKFDRQGRFVKEWGKRGSAPGEFHTPHSIVVDSRGRVYVADRENYRIQVFDADGRFLDQWRGLGAPWGLAFTPDGHLMMADGYNNRIVKLTLDGKVVGAFGSHGKRPGEFHYCHQLSVASDGSVYTSEILNWRAQKFVPVR